jgi:acyl-coenzyme A thioesterase PaaI-like protein
MDGHPLTIPPDASIPVRHVDAPAPGTPITSHYRYCFGCGVDHPTGLHISITAGEGLSVQAQFTVTEHHQGAPGIAHGGLLSTAFDETLGAANWLIRVSAVTAHLEVSYRAPVPVGSTVFITAKIDAVRARKIWASAEGRLHSADGLMAVRAASLFMQVPLEHFTKHGRAADLNTAATDPHTRHYVDNLDIAP